MEISTRLAAFIEKEFDLLINEENRAQTKRDTHLKEKDAERKKQQRKFNKELESLEILKEYFSTNDFQKIKAEILLKNEEKKSSYTKKCKENLKDLLEGKTRGFFNLFVYKCWHLIGKEIKIKDSDIYKWIEFYLKSKEFSKRSSVPEGNVFYTYKDIQRIIYEFQYGEDAAINATHILSLIDDIYADFNSPNRF